MSAPNDPAPTRPLTLGVNADGASSEVCQAAASALSQGQLVAMPTETVYGIAVRADDPDALERLRQAKGRPEHMPLTWHVGTRDALATFNKLRPLAERLADAYWPGPLTLVLEGVPKGLEAVAKDGCTGVRLPAHAATRQILASLDFPVVMTSANLHGQPSLGDAAALEAAMGSMLAIILDAGPSPLDEGSAILRLTPGHFDLLRPGLMDLDSLRRNAGLRLGFVCTGNTCRSPMAEGLARDLLERRLGSKQLADFGFEVSSMGVYANPGSGPSAHGVEVLAERGIDISGHRSQSVPLNELSSFDALFCLTQSHMQALLGALPPGGGKGIHLLDPEGRDVSDPIGGNRQDYEACAAMIHQAIQARAADWA